ncbi:MAG TPA: hypothetical protein VFZ11_01200 [Gemmatimonadaceae bacterium]
MPYDPSRIGTSDFSGGAQSRSPINRSELADRPSSAGAHATPDWASEDDYWRNNYGSRPYARADLAYEHYQPAYRYGYESAGRLGREPWEKVEPELRAGWEVDHADDRSAWDGIKDAVKDAWDRVTGHGRTR